MKEKTIAYKTIGWALKKTLVDCITYFKNIFLIIIVKTKEFSN
jgi:hypothetical protein